MDSTEQATSTIEDSAIASAIAFTEVARSLFLADSVEDSLTRAVDLFVVTLEACEFAGAFLLEGDEVTSRVCTDPIVTEIDALQLRTGEGPCLDAIANKLTFYAGELGTDPRWPNFGPEAAAMGMRSLLALPMATDGTLGALNLYARYPHLGGPKAPTGIGDYRRRMSFLRVFSVDDGMKLTNPGIGFMVRELSHHLHGCCEIHNVVLGQSWV